MSNPYPYKALPVNEFYMNLAESTYNHYGAAVEFKNFQGQPLPNFDDLGELQKKAWHDASRFAYNQGKADQVKKTDC